MLQRSAISHDVEATMTEHGAPSVHGVEAGSAEGFPPRLVGIMSSLRQASILASCRGRCRPTNRAAALCAHGDRTTQHPHPTCSMPRLRPVFHGLALLCAGTHIHALATEPSCSSDSIAAVAHWAGVQGKLVSWEQPGGMVAATACKAMPDAPGTTIAAIAFDTAREGPTRGDGNKLQVIALIEAGQVVAAHRSQIEEDATTAVGRYRIDTARYHLSPSVRAFGTVFHSDALGSRCPDAAADAELTLWVREGAQLRPVLGTNLRGWVNIEGTPCVLNDQRQRSEEAHLSIAVEKTNSHGFADLALTARIVHSEIYGSDDEKTRQRRARTVLRYDGKSYGSDMFRTFWYPAELRRQWKLP